MELKGNYRGTEVFPVLRSPAHPSLMLNQTLMIQLSWTAPLDEVDFYRELKFYQSHIEEGPKKASPGLTIPHAMST